MVPRERGVAFAPVYRFAGEGASPMKAVGVLLVLVLFCADAKARDAFDAIRCGAGNAKVLIGKTMPGGTAAGIEARHKVVGLGDLGADEISGRLQMVSWRICGADYNILVDGNDVMRDVLPFPDHSRRTPEFAGICRIDGRRARQVIYALLDNKAGFDASAKHHYAPDNRTELPALAAWRIDEMRAKFVPLSVSGLRCPRSGINTIDGGP
jgi:hypothetical protein